MIQFTNSLKTGVQPKPATYLVSLHEIADILYRTGNLDAYLSMMQHIAAHDELRVLAHRELS